MDAVLLGIAASADKRSKENSTAIENLKGGWRYKGAVEDYAHLPSTGNKIGDVYTTLDDGNEYAWGAVDSVNQWIQIGGVVNPLTDAEVINALEAYPIDLTITNGTYTGSPYVLGTQTITITPSTGYEAPASITVNGVTGTSGSTGVTWSYSNGVISLSNATGDIAISVDCPEALPTPKASMADYTWAELKILSRALANSRIDRSTLSSIYNIAIGDAKASSINDESHSYRLIGINHDIDANGNTLGMTFEQVDLLRLNRSIVPYMSAEDSWQNSGLKTLLEGYAVDSDLAAVITPAKKVCANNVSSGTPTYDYINTANGLWLESQTEVWGSQTYTKDKVVEGSRYVYYTEGGSTIKEQMGSANEWWTRSPQYYGAGMNFSYFCGATNSGGPTSLRANNAFGVCPCFCI